MTLDRHLARLLAAVIVMIAATFGVSVAQAHEGHAHHRAPAVSAAAQAAAPVAAPVAKAAPAAMAVSQQAQPAGAAGTLILALAAQASGDDLGKTGGCDGHCCNMGMACCHAAVTPAALATLPRMALSSLVLAPQQTLPASLAPEALPKPPRTFA